MEGGFPDLIEKENGFISEYSGVGGGGNRRPPFVVGCWMGRVDFTDAPGVGTLMIESFTRRHLHYSRRRWRSTRQKEDGVDMKKVRLDFSFSDGELQFRAILIPSSCFPLRGRLSKSASAVRTSKVFPTIRFASVGDWGKDFS